ncbi:MAG: hypothetical protein WBA41_01990 [Rivularia sp. (in: cyanobacteria)]
MPYAQCPIPDRIATEILTIYDSPLYVYQGDILRQTIDRITKSIPYPHTKFHFASVTNGNISLLQIFNNCGWGIHANTPGDVYLGLKAGFSPEKIVYSGSNLNAEEMTQLLNWGITTFNLDSVAQLRVFCDIYQSRNLTPQPPSLRGNGENLKPLSCEKRGFLNICNTKEIKLGLRLNLP